MSKPVALISIQAVNPDLGSDSDVCLMMANYDNGYPSTLGVFIHDFFAENQDKDLSVSELILGLANSLMERSPESTQILPAAVDDFFDNQYFYTVRLEENEQGKGVIECLEAISCWGETEGRFFGGEPKDILQEFGELCKNWKPEDDISVSMDTELQCCG